MYRTSKFFVRPCSFVEVCNSRTLFWTALAGARPARTDQNLPVILRCDIRQRIPSLWLKKLGESGRFTFCRKIVSRAQLRFNDSPDLPYAQSGSCFRRSIFASHLFVRTAFLEPRHSVTEFIYEHLRSAAREHRGSGMGDLEECRDSQSGRLAQFLQPRMVPSHPVRKLNGTLAARSEPSNRIS